MTYRGTPVPKRPRDEIADITQAIRKKWKADQATLLPIVNLVETVAKEGFEVQSYEKMGSNLGLTYPDQGKILIRSDVYDAACVGKGWAREVLAHELGHFVMHQAIGMPFHQQSDAASALTVMEDSEWQANTFADLILAPLHIVKGIRKLEEIAQRCGISQETAFRRWVEASCR